MFLFSGKIQKGKQRLELMNSKPDGPPMTQAQTEKNQEQVNYYFLKCAGNDLHYLTLSIKTFLGYQKVFFLQFFFFLPGTIALGKDNSFSPRGRGSRNSRRCGASTRSYEAL